MKSIGPSIHFDLVWLLAEWIYPERYRAISVRLFKASLDSFDH